MAPVATIHNVLMNNCHLKQQQRQDQVLTHAEFLEQLGFLQARLTLRRMFILALTTQVFKRRSSYFPLPFHLCNGLTNVLIQ